MEPRRDRVEQQAVTVLERAQKEFTALGESWDSYNIDVELIGTLLFDLGVQRVPHLRVGEREYAGFLDAKARLVAVEGTHHEHRQRFSIAHEIGHFVLHYLVASDNGQFACTDADMEISRVASPSGDWAMHQRQEQEANHFAGAMLMPERPLRAMHRVTGSRVVALAKHFHVSPQAMEIRLTGLGLPTKNRA